MEQCSICLNNIDEDHVVKKLSCGHKFHYRCYMNIVHHGKNYFVKCPLCRIINTNLEKPFTDPERNLKLLCARKVGKVRCICNVKKGTVCKKKASLFNYGMCHIHNNEILKKELYPLMEKFMNFVFCQKYNFLSRLYTIDIGKKIIIKYLDKDSELQDILNFWFRYLTEKNLKFINNYHDLYDYYELEKPPENWINYCSNRYTIV